MYKFLVQPRPLSCGLNCFPKLGMGAIPSAATIPVEPKPDYLYDTLQIYRQSLKKQNFFKGFLLKICR